MTFREEYRGVHPIVPTPFRADGSLDEASLGRLIDHMAGVGSHGVAILGFLGEAHKLSSAERRKVVQVTRERAGRHMKVLVGVRAFGAAGAIEQAQEARELGADCVFVAPLGVQNDAVLFDFYRTVAERSNVPVMIHDYPESFGTVLSPQLIIRLANEVEGIVGIKLEEPPVLVKLSQILDAAPQLAVLGGLGGVYYLEELLRGAAGIMTGFAYPEVLVDIFERFTSGDVDGATAVFDRHIPLIRYEFQNKIGLAFRKYAYRMRGIIESDHIRAPGMALDDRSRAELEGLIKRVGLSLSASAPAV